MISMKLYYQLANTMEIQRIGKMHLCSYTFVVSIYNNKEMLIHFKKILPKLLANSVEEFIAIKKWQQE